MSDRIWIAAQSWRERADRLRAEGWRLVDLTAVDLLSFTAEHRPSWRGQVQDIDDRGDHRFEVVVQLRHAGDRKIRTVHVPAGGDEPRVASVTPVWPVANFLEREAFDMFGIVFEGHPNLTRILMPDEWEGHPLRKDYGVGKIPIEFVPQPFLQVAGPNQAPSGDEAHVQLDRLGQVVTDEQEPDEQEKAR